MKKGVYYLAALLFSNLAIAQNNCQEGLGEELKATYDQNVNTWEQENPLFRWPLPEMEGQVQLRVQFVKVTTIEGGAVSDKAITNAKSFLNGIFSTHDIAITFEENELIVAKGSKQYMDRWHSSLPSVEEQFTVYVVSKDLVNSNDQEKFVSCGLVSNKALVKYSGQDEFNVSVGKCLGYMLGLLPTYFENQAFGVETESFKKEGRAGDFVSDTPVDYPGLRNDVSRSCRYHGKVGNPDQRNLMADTRAKCIDHISEEQANKIKYNISTIPYLQSMVTNQTTIALNIGIVDPYQTVSSSTNMTSVNR